MVYLLPILRVAVFSYSVGGQVFPKPKMDKNEEKRRKFAPIENGENMVSGAQSTVARVRLQPVLLVAWQY